MAQISREIEDKDLVAEALLDVEDVAIQEMPIFITVSPESETAEFESIFNPPEIQSLPSSNGSKAYMNGDQPADTYENLITEDEEPVDNIPSEKQQRLLVEPLNSSDHIPGDFLAAANVGVFEDAKIPAIVPDMFLSLGVKIEGEITDKSNRSYFIWKYDKPPEVVVESVSNKQGNEKGTKFDRYAEMGVQYYVILDHFHYVQDETLIVYELVNGSYVARNDYSLPDLNLALQFWDEQFEKTSWLWIRWCTLEGEMILSGKEKAILEGERADQADKQARLATERAEQADEQARLEKERAELAGEQARLEKERAEQAAEQARLEKERAEQAGEQARLAKEQAKQEAQKAAFYLQKLREAGVEIDI